MRGTSIRSSGKVSTDDAINDVLRPRQKSLGYSVPNSLNSSESGSDRRGTGVGYGFECSFSYPSDRGNVETVQSGRCTLTWMPPRIDTPISTEREALIAAAVIISISTLPNYAKRGNVEARRSAGARRARSGDCRARWRRRGWRRRIRRAIRRAVGGRRGWGGTGASRGGFRACGGRRP